MSWHIMSQSKELENLTVVATDTGFAKKARNLAEQLNTPLAIVEKRRLGNDGRLESLGLIGAYPDVMP